MTNNLIAIALIGFLTLFKRGNKPTPPASSMEPIIKHCSSQVSRMSFLIRI